MSSSEDREIDYLADQLDMLEIKCPERKKSTQYNQLYSYTLEEYNSNEETSDIEYYVILSETDSESE